MTYNIDCSIKGVSQSQGLGLLNSCDELIEGQVIWRYFYGFVATIKTTCSAILHLNLKLFYPH